jgi:purine-cytosine permease-like protein
MVTPKAYAAGLLPDLTGGPPSDITKYADFIGPSSPAMLLILSIAGVVTVAMTIYSGFLFMTSQGNPDKLSAAKKALLAALVGLTITVSANLIVTQIVKLLGGSIK